MNTTGTDAASPVGLPTVEDIRFYREQGYWLSPIVLPDDLLAAAEHGMHRHHASDVDARLPRHDDELWGWREGSGLRANNYASLRVAELGALARAPQLGAIAAALAGTPAVRLWHDQLLYKPPGPVRGTNVGWHTDHQYWSTCSSPEMLTAWVPFRDVDEDQGPVMFIPGSHRWSEGGDALSFWEGDLSVIEAQLRRHGVEPVHQVMRRGQISFHHNRTIHGSGPNVGTAPRCSMAFHLQPADNHWIHAVGRDGTVTQHSVDTLVRIRDGVPDYTDPAICPQLWPGP